MDEKKPLGLWILYAILELLTKLIIPMEVMAVLICKLIGALK